MPLFARENFEQVLAGLDQANIAPVYLLYGESFLVKSALQRLTDRLIPESQRGVNLEEVDGNQADFRQILDSLNTYTLFPGRRVVIVYDCRVFYSTANLPSLFSKSKEAHGAGDMERAARFLLEVLAYAGWSLTDVAAGAWRDIPARLWQQTVGVEQDEAEMGWFEEVVDYAGTTDLQIPRGGDDAGLLEAALREGFPPEHCLVLSTDTVDKRRSLYRLIEQKGVVVDFTVASGTGQRARSQQDAALKDLAEKMLAEARKGMEPAAMALLLERTGFNLWALKTQMDKLLSSLGSEPLITRQHVEAMASYLREEPLYEFNNLVASRDLTGSLAVLNRLMDQGYHPLQLLSSLANEIRRLLAARELIDHHLPGGLDPAIPYNKFNRSIYPLIKDTIDKESPLAPIHPYALHKAMLRSLSCQSRELIHSLQRLFVTDVVLKSTGQSQRAVMEELVIKLCQP